MLAGLWSCSNIIVADGNRFRTCPYAYRGLHGNSNSVGQERKPVGQEWAEWSQRILFLPGSPEWQARARAEGRTFCGWHQELAGTGPSAGFSWRQSSCWDSPCSVALRKGEEHLVFRRGWFVQMGSVACSSSTDKGALRGMEGLPPALEQGEQLDVSHFFPCCCLLGKVRLFPGAQTCLHGQQTWCRMVQEHPAWLCQCFGEGQGFVCTAPACRAFLLPTVRPQAALGRSEDCRGALAQLSLMLRCLYLLLVENQVR